MLSQKTGNPWTAERTTERVGCSALVIKLSTIDPAAPKGQKEIAQGRAKRRPGYIAHWYRLRLGIRPDFLFWLRQGFVLDHRHVESVTSRLTQCEGIAHGDLWVFLTPKVQSLIEALSCSLGREHD
jgi:hypothetical protein